MAQAKNNYVLLGPLNTFILCTTEHCISGSQIGFGSTLLSAFIIELKTVHINTAEQKGGIGTCIPYFYFI